MNNENINRHQRRKQRTRALLTQCTLDLLLEKGYLALTIQDITDRADVARGTFYVHFKDKDDIIWAIFEESLTKLAEAIMQHAVIENEDRRKFMMWRYTFEYAQTHRDLLRVMVGEQGHPGFAQRIQDYVYQFIENGIQSGIFTREMNVNVPIPFMAQFMTGALVRLMLWSLDTGYTPIQLATMFYETIYLTPIPFDIRD